MTTITLTLPDQTIEHAQQAAAVLHRPVEEVLSAILVATLPSVTDAPAAVQAELMRMAWLDSQELWNIARRYMSTEMQERLQQLSHLQGQDSPLTPAEQEQLEALRYEYGRITLLKARAYALLSLRGGESLISQL